MKLDLSNSLRALLMSERASMVGFADLREIPPENRSYLPLGISIGVALNPRIVSEITEGPTSAYVEECLRLDRVLEGIGQKAVEFLTKHGFVAKQQKITNTPGASYPPNLTTALPHKTVATRAGLGWVGKCALLINKHFGAAVRLGSVLTEAPLKTGIPIEMSSCGKCTACLDTCPANAIVGANWELGVPRNSLVDVFRCREIARNRLVNRIGREVVGRTFCGMCLAACPWTESYTNGKTEQHDNKGHAGRSSHFYFYEKS
jgi:epoxyqueuosine reductase